MYKYVIGWENRGSSLLVLSDSVVMLFFLTERIGREGKSLCMNVKETLQRERGLHYIVARLDEVKYSMMYFF
jgi:hypothetical protein